MTCQVIDIRPLIKERLHLHKLKEDAWTLVHKHTEREDFVMAGKWLAVAEQLEHKIAKKGKLL